MADIVQILSKCYNFAAIAHRDQRRLDAEKTPYINHPIGVAFILTAEAAISDPLVIQAAILHDTVEDTDTSFDDIERHFGAAVRRVVAELTDDKPLAKAERKRLQIEHAAGSSHEAKLVKLADKLYNLRDLRRSLPEGWTEQRRTEYFGWAKQVVDGLRGTNEAMERALDELFRGEGVSLN